MNEATDVVYMRRNQWEMMTIYAKCAKWWLRTVGEVCAYLIWHSRVPFYIFFNTKSFVKS